ncbi:Uncharacterised protein [Klebsiella pneumoniae]|uniref:Uncharacterized protein n=1 Tax=Klebsiella pneumoniae TaxID=573 RepID=A0A2X3C0T6_KLEPN|nr:Uncharacterised protein [Klebsiella pneumoniae]
MAGAAAALLVTVEPGMGIAGMVEHAVEDHAHSRPLGVVAQPEQRRVAAKLRIDAPIILVSYLCTLGAAKTGFRYRAVTPSCFR